MLLFLTVLVEAVTYYFFSESLKWIFLHVNMNTLKRKKIPAALLGAS